MSWPERRARRHTRQAVHVRQPHVEHDQVGAVAFHRRQAVRSGRRHLDVVAGLPQLELEHTCDRGIVLDDEHALRGGVHAPTIAVPAAPLRILTERPGERLRDGLSVRRGRCPRRT